MLHFVRNDNASALRRLAECCGFAHCLHHPIGHDAKGMLARLPEVLQAFADMRFEALEIKSRIGDEAGDELQIAFCHRQIDLFHHFFFARCGHVFGMVGIVHVGKMYV